MRNSKSKILEYLIYEQNEKTFTCNKLSDSKFIEKYTNTYLKAFNNLFNLTSKDSKMSIKVTSILLQKEVFSNKESEYTGIVSNIKSK